MAKTSIRFDCHAFIHRLTKPMWHEQPKDLHFRIISLVPQYITCIQVSRSHVSVRAPRLPDTVQRSSRVLAATVYQPCIGRGTGLMLSLSLPLSQDPGTRKSKGMSAGHYSPKDEEVVEIKSLLIEPTRRKLKTLDEAIDKLVEERDDLEAYVDA
ncbi:hypothetical protein B0H14DRAFT_3480973 [Mycena olivaceomarginata]|nr:hypothetical protein B0H14DRAFT_3480973 [Mycena olivaceomarginata]